MAGLSVDDTLARLSAVHGRLLGAFVERRRARPEGRPTRLQEFALRAIHDSGSMQVSGLSALLDITPATTSQLLTAMEEKGWLAREMLPEDRRRHQVALTAEGRHVVAQCEARRCERLRALLRELAPEERLQAVHLAERFVEILSRHGDAPGEAW